MIQELLELDKASMEITAYLCYMMANSLHIHGRRWVQNNFNEAEIMFEILEGWSTKLKFSSCWLVNFDEEKHPLKQELFHLAMSCMEGVAPGKSTTVPESLRPENGFDGTKNLRIDEDRVVSVNLANNNSNTARYVFNERENGIKDIIERTTDYTDLYVARMYQAGARGHGNFLDNNAKVVMDQDRQYIHANAATSQIVKFPARLLNVDNLEANGTVKQIGGINYPQTAKNYLSMDWPQRQQVKVKIFETYFPNDSAKSPGYKERDAVKFPPTEIQFYLCYNCAKKYVPKNIFLEERNGTSLGKGCQRMRCIKII